MRITARLLPFSKGGADRALFADALSAQQVSAAQLNTKRFHVKHIFIFLVLLTQSVNLAFALTLPEKVLFPSLGESSPTILTGYLYRPSKPAESKSAIVLAHGCSGMIDDKGGIKRGVKHWAARFTEKGYVVLAVDSFNPRGHKEVCTQFKRPILESRERPRDAYGALNYLAAQSFVDKDRVVLMGFSHGATGALYAIEDDGKPHKLAKSANIAFRAALAFYPGCTNAYKARLKFAIAVGIFIGADDDWTPAAPCKALIELNQSRRSSEKRAEYFDYPGAYHAFDVPGTTVRVRRDVRMSNQLGLADGVHVGGNEAAGVAAQQDVDAFLARVMGK